MKCPSCSTNVSEPRGICPGCGAELGAHDAPLGVTAGAHKEISSRTLARGRAFGGSRDPEIDDLFDIARQDVISSKGSESLEIDSSGFIEIKDREDIELLFALAFEALHDPTADKSLSVDFARSQDKSLMSLRGSFESRAAREATSAAQPQRAGLMAEKTPEPPPIDAAARLRSFVLDWGLVISLSLILGAAFAARDLSEVQGFGAGLLRSQIDRDNFLWRALVCFLITTPAYFMASNLIYGMTLGERYAGFFVSAKNGCRLSALNLCARGLLLPLGLLALGRAPWIFGVRRSLHDLLAGTISSAQPIAGPGRQRSQ